MAPNTPQDVDFVVTGPYDGYITWRNPGGPPHHYVDVYENRAAAGYAFRERVEGGQAEFYEVSGLDPLINYCFKLKAGSYEPPEESDFSDQDCETTDAVLAAPTLIITTVFSDFIEITWKDNSADEDVFCIERKLGAGGWSEIDTVPTNVEYYRDTTVAAGSLYTYQVRAKNNTGPTYSGYVTGIQVTANSAPNIPTGPTLSEITDEEMRFSWTAPAAGSALTGYKIEISDTGAFGGEQDEYIVGDDVTDFLFKDLASNDQFWVRVCSYNGVGDSSFTSAVNDWTLAQYVRTDFEAFVRDPEVEPIYIAEIDMKMDLAGFTLTGGQTYTYEKIIDERGLKIDDVWEDGSAYSAQSSIATVEANASSYWWDPATKKLYAHTSAGTDPDNFFMEGGFTHLIPSRDFQYADDLCTLPPWLAKDSIPGITQAIKPYYEGSFRLSSGAVSFFNGLSKGENYFDKRFETFTWIGAKLGIYCGKDSFSTLAKFKKMFTAYITNKEIGDMKITFSLRDIRESLGRELILNKYWKTDYPALDDDYEGQEKFKAWGYVDGIAPVPIEYYDATEKKSAKFHYHDGRTKSVSLVSLNGVAKVEDTDFYVDLKRSIIVFDASLDVTADDIVLVSFFGQVNSADEIIQDGAEVFKHILTSEANISVAELNTDWIYETKYAATKNLTVPLYKDTNFEEVIETIEHSTEAYILQDGEGRIGLRPQQTTVPSKAKYIWNFQSKGHKHNKNRNSLFWKVKVYYNENPQTQEWDVKEARDDEIKQKYRVETELPFFVYFQSSADAQALATNILNLLNKTYITDELPMILFDVYPGDLIPFSRDRFYDSSGTAAEVALRILRIEKHPQAGKTVVEMEKV